MFRFAILLLPLALGATTKQIHPNHNLLIVGGEEASIENFPYQVSLQFYDYHLCGASIISSTRVVTAAHCITTEFNVPNLNVRAGSSNKTAGGQYSKVSTVITHPLYNSQNNDYDVAVLILETRLVFGPTVQPIPLIRVGADQPVDSPVVVSGWGSDSIDGPLSDVLRAVVVSKVSDDDCDAAYDGNISSRMTCFAAPDKGTCVGDVGNPLVANGELVGIASFVYGCADPSYPGVYTRLAHMKIQNFIYENL